MKQVLKKILLSLLLVTLIVPAMPIKASSDVPSTKSQCEFRMKEQKLWIDHVSQTRDYIVSAIASLKDQNDVLERLLKNQDDIGNSIKPYYGEEAGNKLSALLREHIQLAGQVLEAAKTNNKSDLDKYNKLWYQNADQIAAFLSNANPNFSEKELKDMLYTCLLYTSPSPRD